jgi:hypothetical protein
VSQDTQVKLAKAVQSLRGSNRQAWDEFLAVLRQRSAEADSFALETLNSDGFQLRQGIAVEGRRLLSELERAPALAEQLYHKDRQNGANTPRRTP